MVPSVMRTFNSNRTVAGLKPWAKVHTVSSADSNRTVAGLKHQLAEDF